MKNIIQLYFENSKRVPFVVRRESWSDTYGLIVLSVKPRKSAGQWYGSAIGYALPPLDGSQSNSYWGTPEAPKAVNCAGSYQWELVQELPPEWKLHLEMASTNSDDIDSLSAETQT